MTRKQLYLSLNLIVVAFSAMACLIGNQQATAIPMSRPVDFEVQTASPTPQAAQATEEAVAQAEEAFIAPLGDTPTETPDPTTPTPLPIPPTETPIPPLLPTETLVPTETPLPPPTITQTETITETGATEAESAEENTTAAPAPAEFSGEVDPPLQGGDWDFETEFVLWDNPYGDCSGALVASGWTAFVEEGPLGSSCFGENLYAGDVQSGGKSQEITFDFISANSGLLRTIDTRPGHQYKIVAHGKHIRSLSPVQLSLGVDMTGSRDWQADTVTWSAWNSAAEDVWKVTEETVTATGDTMTIFIKGFHPQGDQGGKTFIDNVSVTHLGPA